jgi:hypothetical protein
MRKDDAPETTITPSGVLHEEITSPFSKGKWKKTVDALTLSMIFVTPILYLIALIMT